MILEWTGILHSTDPFKAFTSLNCLIRSNEQYVLFLQRLTQQTTTVSYKAEDSLI